MKSEDTKTQSRVVSVERRIDAAPQIIFELIADPRYQPQWDGNDNLHQADSGQRVTAAGDTFTMAMAPAGERIRENRVVEFVEGSRIAWMPGEPGEEPFGQLWRWEVEETDHPGVSLVRHTYDWSGLPGDADSRRVERAKNTTEAMLMASVDRLAEFAEEV